MFSAVKDMVTSRAAVMLLNKRLVRYGRIETLKIDSKRKTADIVGVLLGETTPIRVIIDKYDIENENGKTWLRVVGCTCKQPWLQNMLDDFVCGRRFDMPAGFLF